MRSGFRIWLKVFLMIIMAGALIWLIYKDETFWQLKQPEGEMVKLSDVRILTEELALAGAAGVDEKQLEEFWKQQSEAGADDLSYGTYKELLMILGQKDKELWYEKKYRDEFKLLKKDWYESYDKLLTLMDMEETIRLEKITLLCGNDGIVGEKKLEEGLILAQNEMTYLPISEEFIGKNFQTIEAYVHGERLLSFYQECTDEQQITNVWVMESGDQGLQIFYEDYEILLPVRTALQEKIQGAREQIADIRFGEGELHSIDIKSEKISGKLLASAENTIELEGYGSLELTENCVGYQLYGGLKKTQISELPIGYDFSDFVMEDGKICAFLITRKEEMKNIRVAIKNNDTGSIYHDEIVVSGQNDMTIRYGDYENRKEEKIASGEELHIKQGSEYLKGARALIETETNTGKIEVLSQLREQGIPAYRGILEVVKTENGLVLINEVPLEEYLYSVVPSEMPASYPLEALKAQAVCARTYGYRYLERPGYGDIGAHVDDSVSYQVYNNIAENVNSTKAVKETAGTILYYEEEPVQAYYYSTSCGFGADAGVWNEEKKDEMPYLKPKYIGEAEAAAQGADEGNDSVEMSPQKLSEEEVFEEYICNKDEGAFEKGEAWFRWEYEVEELDVSMLFDRLIERYKAGPEKILHYTGERNELEEAGTEAENYLSEEPEKIGEIYDIRCVRRKEGGVMDELLLDTDQGIYKIVTEYNIRYILNQGNAVVRQDGSTYESNMLLPSAYIAIEPARADEKVTGYRIVGGGYGHGVGMSQNGAKAMGLEGMSSEEILTFYYEDCRLENVYE